MKEKETIIVDQILREHFSILSDEETFIPPDTTAQEIINIIIDYAHGTYANQKKEVKQVQEPDGFLTKDGVFIKNTLNPGVYQKPFENVTNVYFSPPTKQAKDWEKKGECASLADYDIVGMVCTKCGTQFKSERIGPPTMF